MVMAKVSSKGWIIIPAKERKALGITPGSMVAVSRERDTLHVRPLAKDPIAATYGMLSGDGAEDSLCDALLADHAQELTHERKRLRTRK